MKNQENKNQEVKIRIPDLKNIAGSLNYVKSKMNEILSRKLSAGVTEKGEPALYYVNDDNQSQLLCYIPSNWKEGRSGFCYYDDADMYHIKIDASENDEGNHLFQVVTEEGYKYALFALFELCKEFRKQYDKM